MSSSRPPSSGDHPATDPPGDQSDFNSPTLPGEVTSNANQPTLPPQYGTGRESHADMHNGMTPVVGMSFGDYEIVEEIARGGMGVVYKARQKSLDRTVALKMILSGQFASDDEIRRFNAESTAAAKLDHPNIIPIYDSGVHGDNHYFSMKYIEGSDLGGKLKGLRSDLKSGIAVLEKTCRAIHHAHQRGILHRDLKPGNILIDEDGEPYITDLGLARQVGSDNQLTRTGAVVGTPSYMPPEQAAGSSDITTAADVYSLGAILYELLAGRPPFSGSNVMDTLMQVINEAPERPSLSGTTDRNLEVVALKCLSKEPSQRYPTAEALADDLRRWMNGEPVSVRSPSFSTVAQNWLRQNFGHAIWILIVGLFAGCVAGLGLWFATVQQDMESIRSVYAELPSVDAPFTLAPFSTPDWAVIPSMVVFTAAIMFMGFFTAALARTKNRSADLAAGIMVGIISAAAAFFVCFGTMCVVAMNIDNEDMVLISRASGTKDGESSKALENLFDEYPELEELDQPARIDLMLRKIKSDHLYQARNGIAMGTLSCLFLFLTAGVVETLVAGPIVRRFESVGQAFGNYVFCSYPFVVATVIFGVHLTGVVVLGSTGIVWNWLTIATFATLAVGMIAEIRKWHLAIRIPLVGIIAMLFWCFFAFSFSAMPVVAQSNVDIKKRLRLADRHPDSAKMKDRVLNSMLRAGVKLYNLGYYPQADRKFVDALEYLEKIPAAQLVEEVTENWRTAQFNRANTFRRMKRIEEADAIVRQAVAARPDSQIVRRRAIRYFIDHGNPKLANEFAQQLKVSDNKSWHAALGLISLANPDASLTQLEERFRFVLEQSDFDDALKIKLLDAANQIQYWNLMGPFKFDELKSIEEQLTRITSREQFYATELPGKWASEQSSVSRSINLRKLIGTEEFVSAYAIASVTSDSDQSADIYLGSDDSAQVWVNGDLWQESSGNGRELRAREDRISCELKRGENIILLRIDQRQGQWEFMLQIDGADGWQLPVEWNSLSPATD
jgi:serine/threonine protein kinase/tetratricopeptide (TPR) repeat protein